MADFAEYASGVEDVEFRDSSRFTSNRSSPFSVERCWPGFRMPGPGPLEILDFSKVVWIGYLAAKYAICLLLWSSIAIEVNDSRQVFRNCLRPSAICATFA